MFDDAMPKTPPSKDVLVDILRVLQRIEEKLDGHEHRFRVLEESPDSKLKLEKEADADNPDVASDTSVSIKPEHATSHESDTSSEDARDRGKMPYGDWSVDQFIKVIPPDMYEEWNTSWTQLERFYALVDLSPHVRERLGCCWDMPDDNRFPLRFFKSNILKVHLSGGGPGIDTFSRLKRKLEAEMTALCDFDDALRKQPGNDFVIVDFDAQNKQRMYRLGQQAIGPELRVDGSKSHHAPWSRLM